MTDPIRMSEDGDATDFERELLLAGQAQRLPEGERRALWAGIALSLPAQPPLPALAEPAASHGALAGYLTKGVVFLAVVAGLGVGLGTWSSSPPAPPVARAAPPAIALPSPVVAPSVDVAAEAVPTPVSTMPVAARARSTPESKLREESALVLAARSALRSGDAARCLALLESARQKFPRPALGQEREALTIQALARTGQARAAQRRAASFVRLYPESPYVADLRRLL